MENYIIRQVYLTDVLQLQEMSKQTFEETFAKDNTAENLNHYLLHHFSIHQLTQELNNPCSAFYFVYCNTKLVGYLKVNWDKAQTEQVDFFGLEIERIYVLKTFHGKNVGQLLYDKAHQIAIEKKIDFIWLGVWEKNERAINFYLKQGFEQFSFHIFKLGDDEQKDIMMRKNVHD